MTVANAVKGKKGFVSVPLADRFWTKVEKTDGCWNWQAGAHTLGYGSFWNGKRNVSAHRVAYELLVGPIPEGRELDHLCRNPRCVNPEHLEPVTHSENMRRSPHKHLAAIQRAKTYCVHGHDYTPENTYWYKGGRNCRTCRRDLSRVASRDYRARRRAALATAKERGNSEDHNNA